ncbi:MAG: hypothetical protein A2283_01940 [Lentisphaerae bacterium RIFOXYA12_FULL_48_11]|nr:MAG: hypothetical protein A2283_01940 [Lentisphaerae bacterium RIFOXYA12_FULL_48_11]
MTFFFTSIFIFLVFWRPQEWLLPWMFGWPVLDVVVFMALLALIIEVDQGRVHFPKQRSQIFLLLGLWVASIMSHVVHTYFAGMVETIPEVFKICFFTVLLFCILDRPGHLRALAIMFVLMSCVMSVHAIMQQKLGYGFMGLEPFLDVRPGRADPVLRSYFFGIFSDPNDLAQIIATSIPFTFVMTRRNSFLSILFGCAITCLLVFGIIATYSRSGLVALAGVTAVIMILVLPVRWMPFLMAGLFAGALALCPLSIAQLDISAHDRVVFWGMANQVFIASPLNFIFGIGHGMFWQVASSRAAHNAFVSCYTELGVFGYWFWFILIFMGVMGAWRVRISLKEVRGVDEMWIRRFAGICIAAIIGFLSSAYFLSRAFIYPLFFLVAMLGSLPRIAEKYLSEGHPALISPARDIWGYGSIATVISIIYIYISIILLNRAFYV